MGKVYQYQLFAICMIVVALATKSEAGRKKNKELIDKGYEQTLQELINEQQEIVAELESKLPPQSIEKLFTLKNLVEAEYPDDRNDYIVYYKLKVEQLITGLSKYMRQIDLNVVHRPEKPYEEMRTLIGNAVIKEFMEELLPPCTMIDQHLQILMMKMRRKRFHEHDDWLNIEAICLKVVSIQSDFLVDSMINQIFIMLGVEERFSAATSLNPAIRNLVETLGPSGVGSMIRLKDSVSLHCTYEEQADLHQKLPGEAFLDGIVEYMNWELKLGQGTLAIFDQALIDNLVNKCQIVHDNLSHWWRADQRKLMLIRDFDWMVIANICNKVLYEANQQEFVDSIYRRFEDMVYCGDGGSTSQDPKI